MGVSIMMQPIIREFSEIITYYILYVLLREGRQQTALLCVLRNVCGIY